MITSEMVFRQQRSEGRRALRDVSRNRIRKFKSFASAERALRGGAALRGVWHSARSGSDPSHGHLGKVEVSQSSSQRNVNHRIPVLFVCVMTRRKVPNICSVTRIPGTTHWEDTTADTLGMNRSRTRVLFYRILSVRDCVFFV